MNKDDIRDLVDEEIARRAISENFDSHKNSQKGKFSFLSHPLFLVLFGFILTVGIGGTYDRIIQERQLEKENRERAISAVHDFLRLAAERRVRASLVVSAIRRKVDIEDIESRKIEYDASYAIWNINLLANMGSIRFMFNERGQSIFENSMNDEFFPWLQASDKCLTHAFDAFGADASAAISILSECEVPGINSRLFDYSEINKSLHGCEIAILGYLADAVAHDLKYGGDGWSDLRDRVPKKFKHLCSPYWS